MTCSKCASLMVPDVPLQCYNDALDLSDVTPIPSYRCVICGNVEDAVIVANRAMQAREVLTNQLVRLAA